MLSRPGGHARSSLFRAVIAIAVGATLVGPAASASALTPVGAVSTSSVAAAPDTSQSGYWYYQDYGVAEAAAEGFDGSGVKIAVIDSQINPDVEQFSTAKLTVREPSFCADFDSIDEYESAATTSYDDGYHGNDMVGLIAGNGVGDDGQAAQLGVAQGADVTFYSALLTLQKGSLYCSPLGDRDGNRDEGFAQAIETAIDDGNDIIVIAIPNGGGDELIYAAVARAVRENVVIVAARSNTTTTGGSTELFNMNGVVTVQAMDRKGTLQAASTVADPRIDVVGPGVGILGNSGSFSTFDETSGTSNAAAITAGFLAVVKSKYPDADGSQLIQSLIRNTGVNDHELTYDPQNFIGYGAVSLSHMLANDPTRYESVNPLLDPSDSDRPSKVEIYGSATAAPGNPATDPDADGDPAGVAGFSIPHLIVGGVIGLLVLIGIIVLVIVLVRRSARTAPGAP